MHRQENNRSRSSARGKHKVTAARVKATVAADEDIPDGDLGGFYR